MFRQAFVVITHHMFFTDTFCYVAITPPPPPKKM